MFGREKSMVLIVIRIKNLKILEHHILVTKYYLFLVFSISVKVKMKKKIFKEESIEVLKNSCLIEIIYNYFKSMSRTFRLKHIDETGSSFFEG